MTDFAEAVERIRRARRFADLIGGPGDPAAMDAGHGGAVGGPGRAYRGRRTEISCLHPAADREFQPRG
jgi:hypothetical protein